MSTEMKKGEAAIECEGVGFMYPGAETPALEGINLRVGVGERLGILGPNGGGKSTLLKIILGLLPGYSGSVKVCGMGPAQARGEGLIGYVAQRPTLELGMPISVRELVELGVTWRLPAWKGPSAEAKARVKLVLELVGAGSFGDRPIGKLSGGQLQRALIAKALVASPKVLVLDEPAVGIDASGQRMLAELFERVHRELGLTILIVSHDLRAIAAGSDRVACLAQRLHYHDSPKGLTPALLGELFSHDVIGSISGLGAGGVHVHAHAAGECGQGCEHGHGEQGQGAGRADA